MKQTIAYVLHKTNICITEDINHGNYNNLSLNIKIKNTLLY